MRAPVDGAWAAFWGCRADDLSRAHRTLCALLGTEAGTHVGDTHGVGSRAGAGDPCWTRISPDGAAAVGCGAGPGGEASATVAPGATTLTVTRDPFGLQGAYVARIQGVWWCASDPSLLRRVPGTSDALDPEALHGYLCFSYVPVPLTLTPGIVALAAGERIHIDSGGSRSEQTVLWRECEAPHIDERQAVASLRHLLREAIARRLGSGRDTGVFLSGGLDSSFVAALLAAEGARPHLFTLDFGAPHDAELPFARRVAEYLGCPLTVVPARGPQVLAGLRPTAAALNQPFGDPVTVPLFLLGQAAAGRVGTVFNGEGGDQLFGGWTNKPLVAAEIYAATDTHYEREAAYLQTFHRFQGQESRYYTPRARAAVADAEPARWIRPFLAPDGFRSLLHRLRAANLSLKGAQNIAPRMTQLAGAHGLRLHAPFFDRALAEWSFSVRTSWLLRGACEKYLLKRAAEPFLPAEVIWREKRGMGVPALDWCLGPLRRECARLLHPHTLSRNGWFQPDAVASLRRGEDDEAEYRRRRTGDKLWALLMLHAWLDQHPSQPSQDPPFVWPTAAHAAVPAAPDPPAALRAALRGLPSLLKRAVAIP